MSIQFSRGCPFNCDFCNVTALLGHRPRIKSARQIIAELDSLYAHGWRGNVFFVDDNFIGNKHYLKTDLLPALIRWRRTRKGCVFFTEASINLADDPALMALMVEAGFDTVFIGIETPDEKALGRVQQGPEQRDAIWSEDVKRIQRAGFRCRAGSSSDSTAIPSRSSSGRSISSRQSGIVTAMVGMLQAPPGTRLYERMKQESRLVGDDLRRQRGRHDQHHPENGPRAIDRRISDHHGAHLRAQTLLQAR